MAEQHPAAGRNEVAPVVQPLGRRRAPVVQAEYALGQEPAVEAVGDEVGADGGEHQPGGADGLAAVEREYGPRGCADETDGDPEEGAHGCVLM